MKTRPVVDWPEYVVREDGAVFRVAKAAGATVGRALRTYRKEAGYEMVTLSRHPLRRYATVHRLVAEAFLGPIPPGMDVCHNDGNKQNNHLSNLRIDTRKGNMADQIAFGKTPRGERSGSNKYSEAQIAEIKRRLRDGVSVAQLAGETSMPRPTLYAIRNGQTWGWLNVDRD